MVARDAVQQRWRERRGAELLRQAATATLLLVLILFAGHVGEVDAGRLAEGVPRILAYIGRTLPPLHLATVDADLADWMWDLPRWLGLLLDTALIAYVGTAFGVAAALPLSFFAAARHAPHPAAAFAARRLLEFARSVPVVVFALIFVFAFGLGPLPGAMALAVHSAGSLGKLFAEVHENAEPGPVEATRAAGGSWWAAMRFGVLPQSLPAVVSYGLLRLEINVREAAILGFVGAGGIGQELYLVVRRFEYTDISAVVALILVSVALLDTACAWLRRRITGALVAT